MTSNNPVIGYWLDVVFHTYMTVRCYKYFSQNITPKK